MATIQEILGHAERTAANAIKLYDGIPERLKKRYHAASETMAYAIAHSEALAEDLAASEAIDENHLEAAKAAADNYFMTSQNLRWMHRRSRLNPRQRALLNIYRAANQVANLIAGELAGPEDA